MRFKAGATFRWLALAALMISGAGQAITVEADPYAAVLNGPASLDEVYSADQAMAGNGCRSRECLAMADIADAMTLSEHRDVPNGNALLDPSKFDPRTFDRKIDVLLGRHRDRMPDYCQILIELAEHYRGFSDSDVGPLILDLAARVDRRVPGCLERTVGALPRRIPHGSCSPRWTMCANTSEPGYGIPVT